jgi:hypothetical protein
MQSAATSVEDYLAELPPERREPLAAMRDFVNKHLQPGFEETIQHGMINWVVPFSVLPTTYNGQPLVYAGLAAQKRNFALYLLGVYTSESQAEFRAEYERTGKKLDMGKSCLRFRSVDDLAFDVLGKALGAMSVDEYAALHLAARERPASDRGARAASARGER